MDTAEFATALTATHLHRALIALRSAPKGPVAVGECLFCETPLPQPHRWCDSQCRDAWEADEKRMMM